MKREIRVPFDGFYESASSDLIDGRIESILEDQDINYDDLDSINLNKIKNSFVKNYVDGFNHLIKEELSLDVNLEFKALESPREYNFRTDSIIAEISDEDVNKIYNYIMSDSKKHFIEMAHDILDSRSGFISSYPDFSTEFENIPVNEWDLNQLNILLETLSGEMTDNLTLELNDENCFEDVFNLIDEEMYESIDELKKHSKKNKHKIKP